MYILELSLFCGAGFLVFLFFVFGLKLIGDDQVGILTKRMFGKKMLPGQIVARNGEVGVQADILMPGLYWRIPIIWKITKDEAVLPGRPGVSR